jgi:hypothetical protein
MGRPASAPTDSSNWLYVAGWHDNGPGERFAQPSSEVADLRQLRQTLFDAATTGGGDVAPTVASAHVRLRSERQALHVRLDGSLSGSMGAGRST